MVINIPEDLKNEHIGYEVLMLEICLDNGKLLHENNIDGYFIFHNNVCHESFFVHARNIINYYNLNDDGVFDEILRKIDEQILTLDLSKRIGGVDSRKLDKKDRIFVVETIKEKLNDDIKLK